MLVPALLVSPWIIWPVTGLHVVVCVLLVIVVLLQSGRAADLASAFGAAPTQANMAAMSSEDLIKRLTRVLAFVFMGTSLFLAAAPRTGGGLEQRLREESEKAKAEALEKAKADEAPAPEAPAPDATALESTTPESTTPESTTPESTTPPEPGPAEPAPAEPAPETP